MLETTHSERQDVPHWIEFSAPEVLVQQPLVSVCMITYNHERYLAEAIEGVIRQQTSFPVELIIGEDCSKDRTREIAFEYQRRFPETIRLITSKRNIGMQQNYHRVIMAARGKFIAFCEGDDFWHVPDKLQQQIQFLEHNDTFILTCGNYRSRNVSNGKVTERSLHVPEHLHEGSLTDDLILHRLLVKTLTVCARANSVKAVLKEHVECTSERFLMADTQTMIELSRLGRVKYMPHVLGTCNELPESASHSRCPERAFRFMMNTCELKRHYLAKYGLRGGSDRVRLEVIRVSNLELRTASFSGRVPEAREAFERLKCLRGRSKLTDVFLYWLSRRRFVRESVSLMWRCLGRAKRRFAD